MEVTNEYSKKTVYDPNIISDKQMVSMQMQAVKKGAESFLKMPANERMVNVNVNGYVFNVTRDGKTGKYQMHFQPFLIQMHVNLLYHHNINLNRGVYDAVYD